MFGLPEVIDVSASRKLENAYTYDRPVDGRISQLKNFRVQ